MISIITICRNAFPELQKTVESVLSLETDDYEYIVVDGNSTDSTKDYLKVLERQTSEQGIHFKWISETDRGVYDAMNKGVKMASGEYVIFMNAGDRFYDYSVIRRFTEMIHAKEADAYYGNTLMEFYEGDGILCDKEGSLRNPIMPFIHQSIIVKRDLLLEHPFSLKYRIVADLDFFYWMRQNNKTFIHGNFIVCRYDAKEGLSENNPLLIELERDKILGIDKKPHYWLRKLKLRCTKGVIQPIKDYAPRWLLNYYFRRKKKHIIWI